MQILFIDACPRTDSRTRKLAEALLSHLKGEVVTLKLTDTGLPSIDEAVVIRRGEDAKSADFSSPIYDLAKQFAKADRIVIAAPYWDLSFPAILKKYIEAITVAGITFRYSDQGIPVGLCRAEQLYYVTTSGGPILNDAFGWGYIRQMSEGMYGVRTCRCFKAEGLDIWGADPDALLAQAKAEIDAHFDT